MSYDQPHLFRARNVNEALHLGVSHMRHLERARGQVAPRGMATIEHPGPVVTTYTLPMERVLFHPTRDANPFFHFFEGLWMIAGREDVEFLTRFNKRMAEYSDDGVKIRAAYGQRARHWFGVDQFDKALELLRADPDTRRAVIQIYDGNADTWAAPATKDLPCNTALYLKMRDNALNMTISCRSNDMLWGAYGANAVHFSMILEYLANKLGAEVGAMHQVSDSFHVYTGGPGGELWRKLSTGGTLGWDFYDQGTVTPYSMGAGHPMWEDDIELFFRTYDEAKSTAAQYDGPWRFAADYFMTPFFKHVVVPMWNAHATRALVDVEKIFARDWKRAAEDWISRRAGIKENVA